MGEREAGNVLVLALPLIVMALVVLGYVLMRLYDRLILGLPIKDVPPQRDTSSTEEPRK